MNYNNGYGSVKNDRHMIIGYLSRKDMNNISVKKDRKSVKIDRQMIIDYLSKKDRNNISVKERQEICQN